MTRNEEINALPYSPDGNVPFHAHDYEFNFVDYEGSMGDVSCIFKYTVPPGPRGKLRRVRYCSKGLQPEEVLEILGRYAQ